MAVAEFRQGEIITETPGPAFLDSKPCDVLITPPGFLQPLAASGATQFKSRCAH
jgi:hypothetical protein